MKRSSSRKIIMERTNLPASNVIGALPVEIVELVLKHCTDTKSLIAITEASKTLHEIVKNNDSLLSRLPLRLDYPTNLERFAADILDSKRNYKKLLIVRTRDREEIDNHLSQRLFAKLGQTVKDLTIDWSLSHHSRLDQRMVEATDRRRQFIIAMRHRHDMNPDHLIDVEEAFMQHHMQGRQAFPPAPDRNEFQIEFANVFSHFANIEKLNLKYVHLSHRLQWRLQLPLDADPPENESSDEEMDAARQPERHPVINIATQFNRLKDVTLFRCDCHCFRFISSATNIQKLEVSAVLWKRQSAEVDIFESFLAVQTRLSHLHLERVDFPQLFRTNRILEAQFKLDTLILRNVTMNDHLFVNDFLRSQRELKTIELTLRNGRADQDTANFYNIILKTICTMPKLRSLTITKNAYKLTDVDFLAGISNSSVKNLTFHVTVEDKTYDLFKAFIRIFPGLETVSFSTDENEEPVTGICFENHTFLENVRTLSIINVSVKTMATVTMPQLQKFTFNPGKTGRPVDSTFIRFFERHRGIRHLNIGNGCPNSYFFVTYGMCESAVLLLDHIETATLSKLQPINQTIKMFAEKCPKLKTLKISHSDFREIKSGAAAALKASTLKLLYDPKEPVELRQAPPPNVPADIELEEDDDDDDSS